MERTNTSVGRREHGNGRCLLEEAFGQVNSEMVDEVLHCVLVCYDPDSETGETSGGENVMREIGYFYTVAPTSPTRWRASSRRRQGGEPLHGERHARGRILRGSWQGQSSSFALSNALAETRKQGPT